MFKRKFFQGNESNQNDIVFKDMIFLMLTGFITIFFILLAFIAPGKKSNEGEADIISPGNLTVYLFWKNDIDIDLDLWIKSPNDFPVGYPNRENKNCNLLRDDLGKTNDLLSENFENAFCRKLVEGEYIINVHFYSNKEKNIDKIDFRVDVALLEKDNKNKNMSRTKFIKTIEKTFLSSDEDLQMTILRFKIDSEGRLIESSINNEFYDLFSKKKGYPDAINNSAENSQIREFPNFP